MIIFNRTCNHIKYFYYMMQRKKAEKEVEKYIDSQDFSKFNQCVERWCYYAEKCLDTPLE